MNNRYSFKSIVFSVVFATLTCSIAYTQERTLPTDLREQFSALEDRMSSYQQSSNMFQKSFASDSARLSFAIQNFNNLKGNSPDGQFQRNEKFSALTAEFSSLAGNLLVRAEETFKALDAVTQQVDALLQKVNREGRMSGGQSRIDLPIAEELQTRNSNRAENFIVLKEALQDELDPSESSRSEEEFSEEVGNRAKSIESAASVIALMKSLLIAGGIPGDSTFGNIVEEIARLKRSLSSEKRNLYITIQPYILWSDQIGPTLAIRQRLARIRALNGEFQRPLFQGITINPPQSSWNPVTGLKNSSDAKVSNSGQGKDYLKSIRKQLEKRRGTTNPEGSN